MISLRKLKSSDISGNAKFRYAQAKSYISKCQIYVSSSKVSY